MARTVWGAHKRYMDTYLNVYKGYYVSEIRDVGRLYMLTPSSSLVTELDVITKDIIGSEAVSMMS
jgi:hypothetical protein